MKKTCQNCKAIIFDVDGVIIKSERFSSQYEKIKNLPTDTTLPFFKGPFQDCLVGKADLREAVSPYLKKWKWQGNADEFLEYWFDSGRNVNEEILDLARSFREEGVKCYLATNQEKYRTNYLKEKLEFSKEFDHFFTSSEIGYKKPQNEYYKHILDYIKDKEGIGGNEILYIDDELKNIEAANQFKIKAHRYTDTKNLKEYLEQQ